MLVFDEEIYGTNPVFTSDEHSEHLGRCDQLSLQAVIDKVSAAGSIAVQIQHSADGRHFVPKNGSPEVSSTLTVGQTNVFSGGDMSTAPTLGYVRLSISLSGASFSAHVKVYATMRDQSGAPPPTPTGSPTRGGILFPSLSELLSSR